MFRLCLSLTVLVLIVASSIALPIYPEDLVYDEENGTVYVHQLVPLSRVRRQSGDYIKAGAVHSSQYGTGGQILANKNIASGKHYSIDAQAKYNQYGKHKEGWGGLNYSLRW